MHSLDDIRNQLATGPKTEAQLLAAIRGIGRYRLRSYMVALMAMGDVIRDRPRTGVDGTPPYLYSLSRKEALSDA